MSNKLSGTLTLRLPSGDNRFKAFFNVGESGFATEEYVKQQIAESEKKKEGEYVKKIDIQDTLNSDNSNKPLSANQGKVLKELLDTKVIEAGAVPMDSEPTEGNVNNVVSSDGLAKEFNKFNTEIVLGGVYDVSAHNNGAVFESLQDLLNSSNLSTFIPTSVRRGGMTIKFIQGSEQSSDNIYVQYRLMSPTWSTVAADWQGVDDEPTAGSDNLVKSGGTASRISDLDKTIVDVVGGSFIAKEDITETFSSSYTSTKNSILRGVIRADGTIVQTVSENTDIYFYIVKEGCKKIIAENLSTGSDNIRIAYCGYTNISSYTSLTIDDVNDRYKDTTPGKNKVISKLEFDIDDSVKLIAFCCSSTLGGIKITEYVEKQTEGKLADLTDRLTTVEGFVLSSVAEGDITTLFSFSDIGYYKEGSIGKIYNAVPSSPGICADKVDVSSYETLYIKSTNATGDRFCVLCDSENRVIKNYRWGNFPSGIQVDVKVLGGTYLYVSSNSGSTVTITFRNYNPSINERIDNLASEISKGYVFVSPSGNDANDGTHTFPFKTINKALSIMSSTDTLIVKEGDYIGEVVNISATGLSKLSIVGEGNVRFIYGSKIVDDGSEIQDNTFQNVKTIAYSSVVGNCNLYQHDVNDVTTIISERNIYYGDRSHRCSSTIIKPIRMYFKTGRGVVSPFTKEEALSAMNELANDNKYFWFQDGEILYYTSPKTSESNPIILPTIGEYGITGNNGDVIVELKNINYLYASINMSNCHNSIVENCSSKFANNGAGIRYDAAQNLTLKNCEACCVKEGDDLGDGFNSHGENIRRTKVTLIGCWSHDNNDDGQSEHGNVDIVCSDCLYEYNTKAGFTPVLNNSNYYLCRCIARHNTDNQYGGGFFRAGYDNISTVKMVDCNAYGNSLNGFDLGNNSTYVRCTTIGNSFVSGAKTKYIDCLAKDCNVAFNVGSTASAEFIDCRCVNCINKISGSGVVTIYNSEKVE